MTVIHQKIHSAKQAIAKARVLWGKGGYVAQPRGFGLGKYRVGFVTNVIVPMFHVQGEGDSWDEAFARADKDGAK